MAKKSVTDNQAVSTAATELYERMVVATADYLWDVIMDGENKANIGLNHGRSLGILEALTVLTGNLPMYVIPPLTINGCNLYAINITNEALYRSFVGGKVQYFLWRGNQPVHNSIREVGTEMLNRMWIMIDPYMRQVANADAE